MSDLRIVLTTIAIVGAFWLGLTLRGCDDHGARTSETADAPPCAAEVRDHAAAAESPLYGEAK